MKKMIIFYFFIVSIIGCTPNKVSEICEWKHSQIIGHTFFKELNNDMTALYLKVNCSQNVDSSSFLLVNGNDKMELEFEGRINSNQILIKANIKAVDLFLRQEIRDSVQYKNELREKLIKANLLNIKTNAVIPKSENYIVRYGYLVKRIPPLSNTKQTDN